MYFNRFTAYKKQKYHLQPNYPKAIISSKPNSNRITKTPNPHTPPSPKPTPPNSPPPDNYALPYLTPNNT